MIKNNDYEWETAQDYFNADERFDEVNFYNCWLGTPNFGEFLKHDAVFAGGGARYYDPVIFGDRLADTILRSGAVELAHFADTGGVALSMAENVAATNYTPHIGHRWTGDGYLIMANAACYLTGYSEVREASWGQIKATF
ncbi:hypothetical protein KAU45_03975 [bacterium]|nr:hypothetical protein [bacterium]